MNPPTTGDNLTHRHRTGQMVFARDEQHMLNAVALKLIDERREIAKGVVSAVIESDPLWVQALLLQQPGGIFTIAASTHQQGQIQLARQSRTNPLSIHITAQHQHQLRWASIQQSSAVWGHRPRTKQPDR
jgi:hypothetical protein